ncbi:MAG: hypothetical protein Q8867_01930 [Bacteroidota bacterium]|nr:hypothetical protein [Bacteroidota bacterium]
MKKHLIRTWTLVLLCTFPFFIQGQTAQTMKLNNNFYDDSETYSLPLGEITVDGEIENPGKVDLTSLPVRSVIVKEALLKDNGTNGFVGAYRYDGYSLFDILNNRILKKKNASEFQPIIDIYVEISNDKGDTVVLSWGEIYYPNFLNQCIIANAVTRIVPSKTKDLWPLPADSKLILSQDLVTERNILHPTHITVRSCPVSYVVNRGMDSIFSPGIRIIDHNKAMGVLNEVPEGINTETMHTIFYGKGRGIHSTEPFSGCYLKEIIKRDFPFNRKNLQKGLFVIAGLDGYRAVYTYSEIMNRSDQEEILLAPCSGDGGKFRIFPSCDFFSDRAVKAVSEIRFLSIP